MILQELWTGTYASQLSGCTVTIGVMSNGSLEITIESADGNESWGERVGSIEAREIAYQIRKAHFDEDGA